MIAGQSKLVNPSKPTTDYINVDWIVLYDEVGVWGYAGAFVYMYQLENTAGSSGIRAFNVAFGGAKAYVKELGVVKGDLDANTSLWKGHNKDNFVNLGDSVQPPKETEPTYGPVGTEDDYDWSFSDPDSVSFTGKGVFVISPGYQSIVLYIVDPRPPMYGQALAQDRTSWWGMVTLEGKTYGDPVPVPSPEPSVTVLLLASLMGALWRRIRK